MSKAKRERRLMAPPVGILTIALLLVVALAGSRFGQTQAQDATPAASPTSGECVAATGTAPDAGASDAGTPAAAPVGTPVDTATSDAAIAAATNFVNCYNAGDFESLVSLVTPAFAEANFGSADAATAVANINGMSGMLLSPITVVSADPATVMTYDDGRASINVAYTKGDYQYIAATWYMVMAGDELLIDEEDLGGIAPEGDTVIISASVAEDGAPVVFDQRSEIFESEVTTIHIINLAATTPASYALYMIPAVEGAATPEAGAVAATPTGSEAMTGTLVGMLTVPAGDEADLTLLGLPVGTYVLVNPSVDGSVATLTIASLGI